MATYSSWRLYWQSQTIPITLETLAPHIICVSSTSLSKLSHHFKTIWHTPGQPCSLLLSRPWLQHAPKDPLCRLHHVSPDFDQQAVFTTNPSTSPAFLHQASTSPICGSMRWHNRNEKPWMLLVSCFRYAPMVRRYWYQPQHIQSREILWFALISASYFTCHTLILHCGQPCQPSLLLRCHTSA